MVDNPLSINPGTLRHIGVVKQRSTTRDEYGQSFEVWNTILTTRVGIKLLKQREVILANQVSGQATHMITMRYPSVTVKGGMQIVIGTTTYDIQVPDNVQGRNRVLQLMVLEVPNA